MPSTLSRHVTKSAPIAPSPAKRERGKRHSGLKCGGEGTLVVDAILPRVVTVALTPHLRRRGRSPSPASAGEGKEGAA